MNLADIRAALHDALTVGLPDLTVHRTPVDNPAPPCLMIDTPLSGVGRETFDDARRPVFPLLLLVPSNDPEPLYHPVVACLSTDTPESIAAALARAELECRVLDYGLIDTRRAAGANYLGVEIHVEVWA